MEQFTQADILPLLNHNDGPAISLYMPTIKKGSDSQQNPIRLGNLIKQIRKELSLSPLTTHQLKENLTFLEEQSQSSAFWEFMSLGLAVFITDSKLKIFRLPLKVVETTLLDSRFYLKPLLPLVTTNGKYFILTLSSKDVKLYEATRTDIDKRFLGDIPKSLSDIYDMEDKGSSKLQFRGARNNPGGSVIFGHGGGNEEEKKDVEEFLQIVENGVTKILTKEQSPLIISGVEYMVGYYKDLNQYPHLISESIIGSVDKMTKDSLHQDSWKIIRHYFKKEEKESLSEYEEKNGTGKTSNNINEILPAAFDGKIDTLFVLRDQVHYGQYNPITRHMRLLSHKTKDCVDLLDLATFQVLKNSGTVYSLKPHEMPKESEIACIYRY